MEDDNTASRSSWFESLVTKLRGRSRALTEKELQEAINSSEEEGILNESEGDMLQSIFEFGDTIVREVMVPRIAPVSREMILNYVAERVLGLPRSY